MTVPLVLASASPARLATLRGAGVEPTVVVSNVDEDAVLAAAQSVRISSGGPALDGSAQVLALARAKAEDVSARYDTDALVLGCDSMLELGGAVVGKPADGADARERWRTMRGRSGVLHTGHWLIDDRAQSTGATLGAAASVVVEFADLSDAEIDAYVATGEPLQVAGAFTVDGIGGPYVTRIEGDYHAVVGVSLPLVRDLLSQLGVAFHDVRTSARSIVRSPQPTVE